MTLVNDMTIASAKSATEGVQLDSRIAIVMPVYNEGASIETTVSEVDAKILKKMPNASLFIFEDGSTDNTKAVLDRLSTMNGQVEIRTSAHRKGYPRAVREAIASVRDIGYSYLLFLDSDGQYDPNDFYRLLDNMLAESPDIVIGRRKNRAEPFYRVILSSGLKLLERILFSPSCKDVTSAFRLMKIGVAKSLSEKTRRSKYNFWLEFTARMSEEGYVVRELPVDYRPREGRSNVYGFWKMPKVVSKELVALLRTWWEYRGPEVSKFATTGVTGALVILGVTYLLTSLLHANYLLSALVAIETSIVWAFGWNDRWTFKGNGQSRKWHARLLRYNAVSLAGLVLNETILFALTALAGVYYLTSELVAIFGTFAFNYLANLRWTWNRPINHRSLQSKNNQPRPL